MAYEIDTDRVVAVLINARNRRALNPREVEIILRYVERRTPHASTHSCRRSRSSPKSTNGT